MPSSAVVASQIVLVITAAVLLYIAVADLTHFKISNRALVILAALFFLHALLSGRWMMLYWNVGIAVLLFVLFSYFYSLRLLGGGDVKLLTVALLWVGPRCAFEFAVFLLIFIAIHAAIAKFEWAGGQTIDNRRLIAFAPSIAAALIAVLISGCLKPI